MFKNLTVVFVSAMLAPVITFAAIPVCFAEIMPVLSSGNDNANSTKASNNAAVSTQASSTVTSTPLSDSAVSAPTEGAANFTGTVYSILSGSGISGTNPQITVKNDKGEKKTFIVSSGAAIIGKDGNATTLTWVDNGDNVSIAYITDKEGATAKSIKVSSD